jgi:hypothetical protein
MPYPARTIKNTRLVSGDDSIAIQAGTPITVYSENGPFGTVGVQINSKEEVGLMPRADYNAV